MALDIYDVMRRFACLLALILALPASAQSSGSFPNDVMVGLSTAYGGGPGVEGQFALNEYVGARVGVNLLISDFTHRIYPAGRATAVGSIGARLFKLQGGAGMSFYTTADGFSQPRRIEWVPHAYAGVRSVLATGNTPEGNPASAPHLALRVGTMVTVNEYETTGPRLRPEVALGFAF